jgi:uncharacterized Ntn-hydrolase superfamily protein
MTYSIVARDPGSGLMGIAVQSHHLSVGAHVVGAEPGVGVIAAQSYARHGYVVEGLGLLRSGTNAAATLAAMLDADPGGAGRAQVGIIAPTGAPAAHTGVVCIADAGHSVAEHHTAQANMVRSPRVWEAMAETVTSAPGDLTKRLLAALDAAEAVGGDLRGRQSAAVQVVSLDRSDTNDVVDLRVDDHPEPLTELRRLDLLRRAGVAVSRAFDLAREGDVDGALDLLAEAQEAHGANLEPTMWGAVLLARAGRVDEAADRLATGGEGWIELVSRLPDARMLDTERAEEVLALIERR